MRCELRGSAYPLAPVTGALAVPQPASEGALGFADADHVSRSWDSNTRPLAVSANSREPSAENHTRLTGPVAGDAKARSMVVFPTLRQCVWAAAGSPANRSIPAIHAVAL